MHYKGRILALDYGTKNIGIACSDEYGLTVRPLPSLPNAGRRDFLQKLRKIVEDMKVQELVIGIPLNMDGSSGEAVRRTERFIKALRAKLKLGINGVDERLSTIEALEVWRSLSPRQQKKYRTVDSLAAAFILERYLKES